MENDRGLDDLFGALDDDERPESGSESSQSSQSAADALNAAFIEAATAPVEPLPPAESVPEPVGSEPEDREPVQPEPSEPAVTVPEPPTAEPVPAFVVAERESAPAAPAAASAPGDQPGAAAECIPVVEAAPVAEPAPVIAPPMTRRELRERQRAGETAEHGVLPAAAAGTGFAVQPAGTDAPAPEPALPQGAGPRGPEPEASPGDATPEDGRPSFVQGPEAPAPTTEEPLPAEAAPDGPAIADAGLAALATAPVAEPVRAAEAAPSRPLGSDAPRQQAGRGFPIRLEPVAAPPRRRSVRWLAWFLPLVIVLGGAGAGGWWAWANHEDKIREILGWEIPNDYTTTGNGVEVVVTILPGDFGDNVAITLHRAGVTKTFDAFHDLLVELADQGQEPTFQPGNYRLQQEMSAKSALEALQDPANRITNRAIIPEGSNLPATLEILAQQSGIALEEFQAEAANLAQFGLPAEAVSLEGYLFPASYDLDGTETAASLLQRLVTETFTRLDALGVAPEDRNRFLTLASIVQKESGPDPADPPKIARVFLNRIDADMRLESDATVTYGTCVWGPQVGRTPPDTCGTVWLNQADIDDTSNPYNTRALPGLPVGPISMPGQAALDAVAHPADGPWLFFVAVNLATGETVFSETLEEHDAAVDRLNAWCEASDENAAYCG